MGDEFTKKQVCYALRTCSLVFQKCDGCTSGTKVLYPPHYVTRPKNNKKIVQPLCLADRAEAGAEVGQGEGGGGRHHQEREAGEAAGGQGRAVILGFQGGTLFREILQLDNDAFLTCLRL